jgi:hypothetical protein
MRPVLAVALPVALALSGCAMMHRNEHIAPPQDVEMDGKVLAKLQHEVEEYVQLHDELLHRVPNVAAGASPEQIAAHQKKMRDAIRAERTHARQGEIFKPAVEAAIRRILAKEMASPEGPSELRDIQQGNPRSEGVPKKANPSVEVKEPVTVAVNAIYNDDAPVSSVPPTLLLRLPPLPDEVRYRFVGRDLILRDTEANVILDFIKNAVPAAARR